MASNEYEAGKVSRLADDCRNLCFNNGPKNTTGIKKGYTGWLQCFQTRCLEMTLSFSMFSDIFSSAGKLTERVSG